MLHTPRRGRGRLRVLRTSVVQGLHPIANRAPHGLLERLRGGTCARRPGPANDSTAQRAKRAGQRVLLLCKRRTLRRRRGRRVVHVAFAIFDSVHRRVRGRADRVGHLAWPGREKTLMQRNRISP